MREGGNRKIRRSGRTSDLLIFLFLPLAACRVDSSSATDAGGQDAQVQPSVEHGRLAVTARKCGDCHQSPDPRDGVLSGQATPIMDYPQAYGSNLTPDPDTGIDDQGQPLCAPMPRFADMSDDEAVAIAAYLQSLVPVWHAVPATVCASRSAADGG
jgi:mono/diheme cytochrome c family protein